MPVTDGWTEAQTDGHMDRQTDIWTDGRTDGRTDRRMNGRLCRGSNNGWFCEKFKETVDHLVSGCPIMTPNEYLQRHDRMGQYIHWKICQHCNAPYAKNWSEHKAQKVVETESAKILWDFSIHTNRTIHANKPDITIKDHNEKHAN